MGGDSVTSLAPGFRFHPTDEELVRYYLKRKVCNKPFRFDPISVVDIYKSEPWDLPDKSKLKSRDLEWYFFSVLDKKYGNGSKTNRATERGYWKTTGKDREVRYGSRTVGMKKTLVYHKGRAPRGERTNWVMHEYRLADEELAKTGVSLDAYVLCRIFQKSGSGPKNGEQYGAPFIEEEWEDDEAAFVPGQYMVAEDVTVAEDAYGEVNDIDDVEQKPLAPGLCENAPLSSNYYHGESSNNVESGNQLELGNYMDSGNHIELANYVESSNYVEPGNYVESTTFQNQSMDVGEEDRKPIIANGELWHDDSEHVDERVVCGIEEENRPKEQSHGDECGETCFDANDFLLDEPCLEATDNLWFSSDLFLEPNDLSNTPDNDYFDLEEYLNFLDAEGDNTQPLTSGSSQLMETETTPHKVAAPSHEAQLPERPEQMSTGSEHAVEKHDKNDPSSSKQDPEASKFDPDPNYGFLKQAGHMLGGIHAPAAYASEFSAKDAIHLQSASQPSSSVHVTASMIRISNLSLSGPSAADWSLDKNVNVDFIFSTTGLLQDHTRGTSVTASFRSKPGSILSRALFFFMILWVVIFSISFKVGTCIYTR